MEARRRQLDFLKKTWWVWLIVNGLTLAAVIATLALTELEPVALAAGVVGSSVVWLQALLVIELTGSSFARMGAQAEDWTAEELAKLHKEGWQFVDNVPIDGKDIDHVAVGPGGVILIETKWYGSRSWTSRSGRDMRLEAAADRLFTMRQRLRARVDGLRDEHTRLVIAVWGPDRPKNPVVPDKVTVVQGPELANKLRTATEKLTPDQRSAIVNQLRAYVADHGPKPANRFEEVGATGLLQDAGVALGAAIATITALAYLGRLALVAPIPAAVAAIAAALLVRRRWPRFRPACYGVIAGSTFLLGLVAIAYGYWAITALS